MVMVTPMAFGLGATAYQRYRMRVGGGVNLRRLMVGLSAPEGLSLLYTLVPAVACIGSLLATTSRGALIAFGGGLVLALITLSRRQRMGPWSFVAVLTLAALSWSGRERTRERMPQSASDAPPRPAVGEAPLGQMGGRWVGGSGFNPFDVRRGRATAWSMPAGATPWMEPYEASVAEVARAGFRAP